MIKVKLKNGDIIQTSDKYSGSLVIYGTTRDGKKVYKSKIEKDKNPEDYNWIEVKQNLHPSGFAKNESRTHKKSEYYHVNTPKKADCEVHRLVASCWLAWPEGTVQVHHKDHNKLNNGADNLEVVSAKMHAEIHKEERKQLQQTKEK